MLWQLLRGIGKVQRGSSASLCIRHPPYYLSDTTKCLITTSVRSKAKTTRGHKETRLVLALKKFYELEGHFAVPCKFYIPTTPTELNSSNDMEQKPDLDFWPPKIRGMKLGLRVKGLRTRTKIHEELVNELLAIGFPLYTWKEYIWKNATLPALETFKRLENDLLVPVNFIVPYGDSQWPRSTWSLTLGSQVSAFRKYKDQLDPEIVETLEKIGFIWDVKEYNFLNYFMPSMRTFNDIYGHTNVPVSFVVPKNDSRWPKKLRGYTFGNVVSTIRKGSYASSVEKFADELKELKFSFRLSQTIWDEKILPALKIFWQLHNHCDVPSNYIIPSEEPWPKNVWGMNLGLKAANIRQGYYAEVVAADQKILEQLGFIFHYSQRIEIIVRFVAIPALRTFKQKYGALLVPCSFIVPEHDDWPSKAHNFRLGRWITRVRYGEIKLSEPLKEELNAIGFKWRGNDVRWHEMVLPAFQAYAKIHGSCEAMNTSFIVPSEEPYPKLAWGLNLGGTMWHIRNGDSYVKDEVKYKILQELGVL
jgi:hypothetical protein